MTETFNESFTESPIANIINTTAAPSTSDAIYPMIVERTIMFSFIWPVIVLIGIVGNALTMVVIHRVNESSTTSRYLFSLALTDTLNLGIKSVYMVCTWWQLLSPDQYLTWKVKSYSFYLLSLTFEKVSKYITVAIVFDRIVAVLRPFRYKELCTPLRTLIAICIIYGIVISTSLPIIVDTFLYFYENEPNSAGHPVAQAEVTQYVVSRLFNSKVISILIFINRISFDFVPIPTVMACNIIIIIGLRKGPSVKSTTDAGKRERQLTKLLLTISFVFLLFCGPYDIFGFLIITQVAGTASHFSQVMVEVLTILTLLNSSINFVIYVVMNKKYREGYLAIMCMFRRDEQEENTPDWKTDKEDTKTGKKY